MAHHRWKIGTKRIYRKLIKFGIRLTALLLFLTFVQVAILRYINPPTTMRVIWEYTGHLIKSEPYRRPTYIWRSLEKISPYLRRAVLAAEDQRFLGHHGFDIIEIRKATKDMLLGQRLRGASTISMQTARTVYLLPVRSILRKAAEAYYTAIIELLWDKGRILEIYLNTVDWGTGVMGAEAASMVYFKRHSNELNLRQAALLAAILPNPHRLSPIRPNDYVKMRVKQVLSDIRLMPLL